MDNEMANYLIVDAHEDIAWNIQTFNRNYLRSVRTTRKLEAGGIAPRANGDTLLGWPEYQRGRVAVVFATLFAAPIRRREGTWDIVCYTNEQQAAYLYRQQRDIYSKLVEEYPDHFRLLTSRSQLDELLVLWNHPNPETGATESPEAPVGLVLTMEGAEGVRDPSELEEWWNRGVRLISPAWAGTRYCGGTREPGPLTSAGYALLEAMDAQGFTLDLSHMDETAALQALDFYPGPVVVTHGNPAQMLRGSNSNRHLSDRVIAGVLDRQGMIGVVPYNVFLRAGWEKGDRRELVSLKHVAAHIDYICQQAGDAWHVGIGSDFDGGFGLQAVPPEIDSIADLQKLTPLLAEMGYTEEEIAAVLGENWSNRLREEILENG